MQYSILQELVKVVLVRGGKERVMVNKGARFSIDRLASKPLVIVHNCSAI